jgi:hypothetical protein
MTLIWDAARLGGNLEILYHLLVSVNMSADTSGLVDIRASSC